MDADEEMERISNLVQRVRETETPGKYGSAYSYSKVVYAAFREISALSKEGFSMTTICKVMENDGLLPKSASPYSFRRAFKRELERRERTAKISGCNNSISDGKGKESAASSTKHIATDNEKNVIENEAGRSKKQIGSDAKNDSQAIKKFHDGSFEY